MNINQVICGWNISVEGERCSFRKEISPELVVEGWCVYEPGFTQEVLEAAFTEHWRENAFISLLIEHEKRLRYNLETSSTGPGSALTIGNKSGDMLVLSPRDNEGNVATLDCDFFFAFTGGRRYIVFLHAMSLPALSGLLCGEVDKSFVAAMKVGDDWHWVWQS